MSALAVWSTWGLAVRWLGEPALVVVFYNAVFALTFQGLGLMVAGRNKDLQLGREPWGVILLGLCALANIMLYFYALRVTTVAVAVLTHYSAPVFVAVLAPFLLKDRMNRATVAALVLAVAGLVLLFLRGLEISGGAGLMGALAGTGSGVFYALVIIFSRGLSARHHPLKVAFYQSAISLPLLGAFVFYSDGLALTLTQALIFAAVGLFHSTVAIVLYMYGIREVTAQEAGVLGYLEPLLAIVLAFFFLGEFPRPTAIAGGALIVASGVVVMTHGGGRIGGLNDNRG